MGERLSLRGVGKTAWDSYGRQPDSGNPTVRDDKGGLRKRDTRFDSHLPRNWKRWIRWKLLTYLCARRISIPTSPQESMFQPPALILF